MSANNPLHQADNVWTALQRWLPTRDRDKNWWWSTTGFQLASLLRAAGYTPNEQYEALLFHYFEIVTRLGKLPMSTVPSWQSFMTDDFSPIEYSWKWGYGTETPEIRYGIEPIGSDAGTTFDPLNQVATLELVRRLNRAIPEIDLTWFDHLRHLMFGAFGAGSGYRSMPRLTLDYLEQHVFRRSTMINYDTKGKGNSSMFLALELVRSRLSAKAYFIPVKTPEQSVASQIFQAIKKLDGANLAAIEDIESYLRSDSDGSTLQVFMVGIDCVAPEKSRLKLYVRSPQTSFDFVRGVMSLGGRLTGQGAVSAQFQDLWNLVMGLDPKTLPEHKLPNVNHVTSGTCFHIDVAPISGLPTVKAYIPVRHYANSDLAIATGLGKFLKRHNRAAFVKNYMHALEGLATRGIDQATGVQTYISCAYQHGELALTSYLSPQVYHPDRW